MIFEHKSVMYSFSDESGGGGFEKKVPIYNFFAIIVPKCGAGEGGVISRP